MPSCIDSQDVTRPVAGQGLAGRPPAREKLVICRRRLRAPSSALQWAGARPRAIDRASGLRDNICGVYLLQLRILGDGARPRERRGSAAEALHCRPGWAPLRYGRERIPRMAHSIRCVLGISERHRHARSVQIGRAASGGLAIRTA